MEQNVIRLGRAASGERVCRVEVAMPPLGGKCWVLAAKGIYILEEGPGTLRTIACTHAGSGGLIGYDGVPNEEGLFLARRITLPAPVTMRGKSFDAGCEVDVPGEQAEEDHIFYPLRNGRDIYRATQAVMGSWMLDAGFHHGLTLRATGGHAPTAAFASVVWAPYRQARRG